MAIKPYGQYLVTDTESELLAISPQGGQIGYPMDTKIRLIYTGSSWLPNSAVQVLRGTANVDGKTVGNTVIYTMASTSYRFVPLGAHVEVINMTGTVGIAPTLSVGTNATSYNNLFTSTALSSLLASSGQTQSNALTIAGAITPLTSGQAITARVSVAATLYTTYTVRIDILGYYET